MITNVLGTPDDHRSDPPDVPTYEQAWQGCDLAYPKPNWVIQSSKRQCGESKAWNPDTLSHSWFMHGSSPSDMGISGS